MDSEPFLLSVVNAVKSKLSLIWGVKKEFRLKVFFLTLSFFLLTGCQAIWRPLKIGIFAKMVGADYVPLAKIFVIIPIILLILLYSKLVDWLRRYQLMYCFTLFHGIGGVILYFFLAHPVYGIANPDKSLDRIFGWIFYFFLECFGAFMSATFWAFADSINSPKDAKNYYGIFVSGSKIGGITCAGILYYMLIYTNPIDANILPNSLLIGSILLLGAAGAIYMLMKFVPGYLMHGYEAAYQIEKKRDNEPEKKSILNSLRQAFEGVTITLKNPYVLGLFSLVMFYEIIIVIFDFIFLKGVDNANTSAGEITAYYALYILAMQSVGLAIAFFGTVPIQRFLGNRLSLFVCPGISIMLIIVAILFPTPIVIFYLITILRAINYGLNHPTREALYIPTTKAIKFKAKAWIDSFGSRLAKSTGSIFNIFIQGMILPSALFSLALTPFWLIATYFLGKEFQKAVDNKKVIGADE